MVAAVLTGCWAVLVTLVGQVGGWGVDQAVLAAGLDRAVPTWPLVALGTVLLVGAPTLALALLPRSPAVRATGRAWLAGTLALGALTLLRAVPPVHEEAYLAA
ncbi:peptidase S8, partial [Micromonospora globispora]